MCIGDPLKGKAIIVGPETGDIPQSITKAFRNLGWESELFVYGPPHMNLVQLAINRVADPHCDKAYSHSFNERIREGVIPLLRQGSFDILLILKGNFLDEDNREVLLKSGVPIVLWTLDSLHRAPYQKLLAEIAVAAFYIDGGDIPTSDNGKSSWLPLGYDKDLYHPGLCLEKSLDVLLIGKLGKYYTKRMRLIKRIADSHLVQKWRCGFIGSTGTLSGNLLLYFHYGFKKKETVQWLSRRIPVERLTKAIASAKICLNIHQDDGITPINPMFFAIPGTGTCMVAEKKPHLSQWLIAGEEYVEFEDDNLVEILERLLTADEERETIAYRGQFASFNHTYESRIQTILQKIGHGA